MNLQEKKEIIKTKYVFTENNQVYLKMDKNSSLKNKKTDHLMEWFPINFQWIPVVELQKNLKLSKMKNLIAIWALFALLFTSCSDDSYVGEGPIVTEVIVLNDFSAIENMGTNNVEIVKGSVQKVEVTGHANIIDRLKREVGGNTWRIELQEGSYKNADLSVHITVPEMNRAILEGSGMIVLNDFSSQEQVALGIYGSGDIEVHGNDGCKNLNVVIEGSGNVFALEEFPDIENTNLRIIGSGSIIAYPLKATNSSVDIVGSGICKVNVETDLKVRVEGSGTVYYKGNPTIDSSVSGSGKVIDAN